MNPNADISTTTNQYLAPEWVDGVLHDNRFLAAILEKKTTKKWDGSQMLFPLKYQKGVPSVAFNGFDPLPITQQPVSVNMTFYPSFVATNVALAGSELSVNMTNMKVLDLMTTMMESRTQDAADDIGNFLQGDGSSFGGKAPMGLAGIVDNGSDLASYAGLSRASYVALNATVTASGGSISLLKVRQLWNSISDGPVRPNMIITDYTTWAYFEQLLTPFQRNVMSNFEMNISEKASASGYADLIWDGMEVYRDKKIVTGDFYMLNTKFLNWYSLNWWEGEKISPRAKVIEGNVYEDGDYDPSAFTWTGWIRPYNMGAINGFMIFGGQLICTNCSRQAVLNGINGD